MSEGAFEVNQTLAYPVYVSIQHPTLATTATLNTGNSVFDGTIPASFDNWFGDGIGAFAGGNFMVMELGSVTFGGGVSSGVGDYPEGYMFDMQRWMG
jgi:hypothetical protein